MIVFNVLLGEDTLMEKIKDSSNTIKKKIIYSSNILYRNNFL